jgi:hypothetical protein
MPESIEPQAEDVAVFSTDYDYKPLEKGFFERMNETVFGLMSGRWRKKAPMQSVQQRPSQIASDCAHQQRPVIMPTVVQDPPRHFEIPKDYEIQNGLLFRKKTLPERVRDSIKFPALSKLTAVINGCALLVFCAGTYILYAELPGHPNLVAGILLAIVGANVLISRR